MSETPSDCPTDCPVSEARRRRQIARRRLAAATLALIAAAWVAGFFYNRREVAGSVADVLPGAARVEPCGDAFVGYGPDPDQIVGYAAVGRARGYGGPIKVLVGIDPDGKVLGLDVLEHGESPAFFRLLRARGFLDTFVGRTVGEPLLVGEDLDAVSGATLTAEGVAAGVRRSLRASAADGLRMPLPPERSRVKFGPPEITLILLFAFGYLGRRVPDRRRRRTLRRASLLVGLLTLGFLFAAPLTLAHVVALIGGHWPDWHNYVYWYLLIGGVLVFTVLEGGNPYCGWLCPFGAYQECLGTLAGAGSLRPRKLHHALAWMRRGLALAAIVLGLVLRRPGAVSYEPFGALFGFVGDALQWGLLLLVTAVGLLLFRPFCEYLCPVRPSIEFIAAGRRWAKEAWRK